eukprot:1508220-Prymnesium_polylepis.1
MSTEQLAFYHRSIRRERIIQKALPHHAKYRRVSATTPLHCTCPPAPRQVPTRERHHPSSPHLPSRTTPSIDA